MKALQESAPSLRACIAQSAKASVLAAVLIHSFPASAVESPKTEPSSSWGLGIGAASKQKPYTGIDRDNKAIPIIQFENKYVRVFGPGVEVKLPGIRISDTQRLDFGLVGRFDLSAGYEADDSPMLAGMSERKGSFWAGAKAKWENSLVNVTAEWTGDASGNSKGQLFSLGLDRTWRIGEHVMLTPRLVAKWQDRKYVDYYFGVRDNEVRTGRAAYRGDAGVNAEIGLRSSYMFDQHHSVYLDVAVTSLASKIKDSPLVDRSTENSVFLGYVYRFR
ncbi:MipA/OmpV family protein [Denitratisoma sp. agr-D3]